MSEDWERGYAAGWRAAMGDARRDIGADMGKSAPTRKAAAPKRKRKASPYNRRYAAAYKRLKAKHPRSSFAALAKKAHKEARRGK